MRKIASLLTCLGILVGGIALEAPASDVKPSTEKKSTSAKDKVNSSKVDTETEFICLQGLIYTDGVNYYWLADVYDDALCTNIPYQEYLWTVGSYAVPQACNEEAPECLSRIVGKEAVRPSLKKALPTGLSYIDVLKVKLQYSASRGGGTWDPKEGLKDSGELKRTFVKVKNAAGKYFPVRLSAGVAKMDKVKSSRTTSCCGATISDRKILVGFETEMLEADVLKLAEALPTSSKRYPNCPTTFMLRVGDSDYHVTTTSANGVQFEQNTTANASPIVNKK